MSFSSRLLVNGTCSSSMNRRVSVSKSINRSRRFLALDRFVRPRLFFFLLSSGGGHSVWAFSSRSRYFCRYLWVSAGCWFVFYPDFYFLIILNWLDMFRFILNKLGSRFAQTDFIGFLRHGWKSLNNEGGGSRVPRLPLGHYLMLPTSGYPLPGCSPAEPGSVSPKL